ncbi:MAG: class I SAM-dependent RNA methyltransferase [Rhodothermales bacterium]
MYLLKYTLRNQPPDKNNVYQYQQANRYFAQIAGGLEPAGAEELASLGAKNISESYRGAYFNADKATLYRVNYQSRLATRILAPLLEFDCHSDKYLYKTAQSMQWTDFMGNEDTFAVFANVSNSNISHSKFAALRLKDAIVDQFREHTGERPNIDTRNPDLWINLHIEDNHATISLDTSGGSLHRRGYRVDSNKAPIQETVGAAIIKYSEWDGSTKLYDPFCGSGTLLFEGLMHYANIPAGYLRKHFGFERMPDYDASLWQEVRAEIDALIREVPEGLIAGSDRDRPSIEMAKENAKQLVHGEHIKFGVSDFRALDNFEGYTIVTNPPYGIRMGDSEMMAEFYKSIGDFLKQKCTGTNAYIYFGNREWIKKVGLRPTWKKPLVNGALDGRLVKYEMY